eukprot:5201359-Amphidinium_carterae.2
MNTGQQEAGIRSACKYVISCSATRAVLLEQEESLQRVQHLIISVHATQGCCPAAQPLLFLELEGKKLLVLQLELHVSDLASLASHFAYWGQSLPRPTLITRLKAPRPIASSRFKRPQARHSAVAVSQSTLCSASHLRIWVPEAPVRPGCVAASDSIGWS